MQQGPFLFDQWLARSSFSRPEGEEEEEEEEGGGEESWRQHKSILSFLQSDTCGNETEGRRERDLGMHHTSVWEGCWGGGGLSTSPSASS